MLTVPIMTLEDMLRDLVWLDGGRYVGQISTGLVMGRIDFGAYLAASRTTIEGKRVPKEVPTFGLWLSEPDRLRGRTFTSFRVIS